MSRIILFTFFEGELSLPVAGKMQLCLIDKCQVVKKKKTITAEQFGFVVLLPGQNICTGGLSSSFNPNLVVVLFFKKKGENRILYIDSSLFLGKMQQYKTTSADILTGPLFISTTEYVVSKSIMLLCVCLEF